MANRDGSGDHRFVITAGDGFQRFVWAPTLRRACIDYANNSDVDGARRSKSIDLMDECRRGHPGIECPNDDYDVVKGTATMGYARGSVTFDNVSSDRYTATAPTTETCGRCGGSGIYYWATAQGPASGECFGCLGSGRWEVRGARRSAPPAVASTCATCGITYPAGYTDPQCLVCRNETAIGYAETVRRLAKKYGYAAGDTLAAERAASLAENVNRQHQTDTETRAVAAPLTIRDGRYTVAADDGTHRTFRFTSRPDKDRYGRETGDTVQFVALLRGPDNTADYTTIATIKAGNLTSTRDGRAQSALTSTCLRILVGGDVSAQETAGRLFATLSGNNCYICGRDLTDPISIATGVGPTCREKEGIEPIEPTYSAVAAAVEAAALAGPETVAATRAAIEADFQATAARAVGGFASTVKRIAPINGETYDAWAASLQEAHAN